MGHSKLNYFVLPLRGVAAAKSPIIFIGTREHMDKFKVFDVKPIY